METQKALLATGHLRLLWPYPRHQPLPTPVHQALLYLFHHCQRLRYHEFRRLGCPISSGVIESACKLVVQARMKQAGMQWSRSGAASMLALRSVLLSDR